MTPADSDTAHAHPLFYHNTPLENWKLLGMYNSTTEDISLLQNFQ